MYVAMDTVRKWCSAEKESETVSDGEIKGRREVRVRGHGIHIPVIHSNRKLHNRTHNRG